MKPDIGRLTNRILPDRRSFTATDGTASRVLPATVDRRHSRAFGSIDGVDGDRIDRRVAGRER